MRQIFDARVFSRKAEALFTCAHSKFSFGTFISVQSKDAKSKTEDWGILGAARRRKVQNLLLLCRIAVDSRDRHATKKKQYFVTIVYVLDAVKGRR